MGTVEAYESWLIFGNDDWHSHGQISDRNTLVSLRKKQRALQNVLGEVVGDAATVYRPSCP